MKRTYALLGFFLPLLLAGRAHAQPYWEPPTYPSGAPERIEALAAPRPGVVVAGARSGIYRSDDGGATWRQAASVSADALAARGDTLLAAGSAGVYVSTDGGATWGRTLANPAASLAVSGAGVYAGGRDGHLYRAAGAQGPWVRINTAFRDQQRHIGTILSAAASGATVLYQHEGSKLSLSTDGGASWGPVDALGASALTFADGLFYSNAGATLSSSPDGRTWTPLASIAPSTEALLVENAHIVVAGRVGLLIGEGRTRRFEDRSAGLAPDEVYALAADPSRRLYAGTSRGVQRSQTNRLLPAEAAEAPAALGLRLLPVAPNPARGAATAQVAVDRPQRVTLRLVDARGAHVRTLPAADLAPGVQAVPLRLEGLASGLYFLVLEGAAGVQAAPVQVVR